MWRLGRGKTVGWEQRRAASQSREEQKRTHFLVPFFERGVRGNLSARHRFRDSFWVRFPYPNSCPFFGFTKGSFITVRKTDPFLGPENGLKNGPENCSQIFGFRLRWVPISDGGESDFGASGWPAGGAPADTWVLRLEFISGGICGRDPGMLAWPARGIVLEIWHHMRSVARIVCAESAPTTTLSLVGFPLFLGRFEGPNSNY